MVAEYLINPTDERIRGEAELLVSVASKGLRDPSIYSVPGVQGILRRNGIQKNGAFQKTITDKSYLPLSVAGAVMQSVEGIADSKNYLSLKSQVSNVACDLAKQLETKIINGYASLNDIDSKPQIQYTASVVGQDESNLSTLLSELSNFLPVNQSYQRCHDLNMLSLANDGVTSKVDPLRNQVSNIKKDRRQIGSVIIPTSYQDDLGDLIVRLKSIDSQLAHVPIVYAAFSKTIALGDEMVEIGSEVAMLNEDLQEITLVELKRASKELQISTIQGIARYNAGSITLDDLSKQILDRSSRLEVTYDLLVPHVSEKSKELLDQIIDSAKAQNP